MQTQPAAGATDAPEPAALTRAIDDTIRRLAEAYPAVAPDRIASVLRASYERTREAKVQQYRLVLAEREARHRLCAAQRAAHPVGVDTAPVVDDGAPTAPSQPREMVSTS